MKTRKNHKRNARGFTMIEILVYCALFSLVMGCVYWVFQATLKYHFISDCAVDTQQNAMVGMTKIVRELSEACAVDTSMVVDTGNPPGIIFSSPKKIEIPAGSGNFFIGCSSSDSSYSGDCLLYNRLICYYVARNNGISYLFRKELAITASPSPNITSTYPDHDTCLEFSSDSSTPRMVAQYVTSISYKLQADTAPYDWIVRTINVVGKFEKSPRIEKKNDLDIMVEVKLRNKFNTSL